MMKQAPQADFWEESEFNKTCPSRSVNFCRDGRMRFILYFNLLQFT